MPTRFDTTIKFPAHFTPEQKTQVLTSVEHCAVKEVVKHGADVDFRVSEV